MNLIDTFRQQHDQIEQVAADISNQLNTDSLAISASEVRKTLRHFLTRLKIHNSLEEASLHTSLLHHQNAQVAAEASRLMGEAATLTKEVEQYRRYWLKTGVIESRPVDFIDETQSLLNVIHNRLNREDRDLLTKVEKDIVH